MKISGKERVVSSGGLLLKSEWLHHKLLFDQSERTRANEDVSLADAKESLISKSGCVGHQVPFPPMDCVLGLRAIVLMLM